MRKNCSSWLLVLVVIFNLFSFSFASAESVEIEELPAEGIITAEKSVALSKVPDNIKNLVSDRTADKVFMTSGLEGKAEMFTLRTENLETGEGVLRVHSVPVKYVDQEGDLRFIDTSIKTLTRAEQAKNGFTYRNSANSFSVEFGDTASKGINFNNAFTFEVASNTVTSSIGKIHSENGHGKIIYSNAFGTDTKLEYINTENGIKENIILDKYTGQSRFDFIFRSSTHIPVLTEDRMNILVVDKNDPEKIEYRFFSLYAYDSFDSATAGESKDPGFRHMNEDLYYELVDNGDGVYTVTVVVPEGYLTHPEIVYPVTIDPSLASYVSSNGNTHDTFVDEGNPNSSNNGNLDYIRFGKKNGHKMFGYHRFNSLPSLPTGANVTSAYLKFTFRSGQNTPSTSSGIKFWALKVTGNQWYESTITWNNQPYGSSGPYTAFTYNGSYLDYVNADVTDIVKSWYNGSPNYGIDFTYSNEDHNDYNSVVSSEGEANRAPVLTITYDYTPTGVSLSPNSATLNVGDNTRISATVTPSNAANKTVTWFSSDSSVASVDSSGYVTAKKVGSATITARTTNGKTATCSITVNSMKYIHDKEDICAYATLSGGIPIAVSYRVYVNASVCIDQQASSTSRRVSEVSSFTKLDRSAINPVLASPQLGVGTTEINGTAINLHYDSNVLTTPSWMWDNKTGYPNLNVGKSATFSSLAVCFQSDALYPYREVEVSFVF